MAYDKAVDSVKLETGLTTIADAIRAKGGTSAPLEFPQGMAQAIADIPTGGGLPFNWGIKSGEFTSVSEEYPFTIQHNCGTVPQYFCLWDTKYQNCPPQCFNFLEISKIPIADFTSEVRPAHATLICRGPLEVCFGNEQYFNGKTWGTTSRTYIDQLTATDLVLASGGQYSRPLKIGENYRWIAIWDKGAPNG